MESIDAEFITRKGGLKMKKLVKLLVLLVTASPILIAGGIAYNNPHISMLSLILILCLGACSSFSLIKIYELAGDIYDRDKEIVYKKRQIKVLNDEIDKQTDFIKTLVIKERRYNYDNKRNNK